jgi:hypothetical protein
VSEFNDGKRKENLNLRIEHRTIDNPDPALRLLQLLPDS